MKGRGAVQIRLERWSNSYGDAMAMDFISMPTIGPVMQGCTPRPDPGGNGCPGAPQPRKFSRMPRPTPKMPRGLIVTPPRPQHFLPAPPEKFFLCPALKQKKAAPCIPGSILKKSALSF